MSYLLHRMPFSKDSSDIIVRGERVRVRANQIILWVSLTLWRVKSANPTAIPFPVILDTGHTHSLSLQERHLIEWAGLYPEMLAVRTTTRDRGQRLLLREASIWVHPNVRGMRVELADLPPHLVKAERGIAIYPSGDFPRLPILGLRAIAENGLILKVNGPRREATLRTPIKWWPFD